MLRPHYSTATPTPPTTTHELLSPLPHQVAHQLCVELHGEAALTHRRIQVRTFNLKRVSAMRELEPSNIDQMVAIKGMVTRCVST